MIEPRVERAIRVAPAIVVGDTRIVAYARVTAARVAGPAGALAGGSVEPVALRVESPSGIRWLDLDGREIGPLE